MTEQEVQWGEWSPTELGYVARLSLDGREAQYADASYLNALEREVRDLRVYKVLADRFYEAQGRWALEAWENNMDYQDWEHEWRTDYDSLPSTSEGEGHESATAGKE